MRATTTIAVASLVFGLAVAANAQQREGVVVMPLKSSAITTTALAAINELLVYSVTRLSPYKVVTKTDIEAQLDREQMQDMLDCDAVACAAEIGGALGTRYLLAGSVRKLGSNVIVSIGLIDTVAQETRRGQAKVTDNEDLYERAVGDAIRQVLGMAEAPAASLPTNRPSVPPRGPPKPDYVQQPDTDLFWLRCPVGQKWDGYSCRGKPTNLKWTAATEACPKGYRLPKRGELVAILDGCDASVRSGGSGRCKPCGMSRLCSHMFGSGGGWYWSASFVRDPAIAYYVYFSAGSVATRSQEITNHVRCVARGR